MSEKELVELVPARLARLARPDLSDIGHLVGKPPVPLWHIVPSVIYQLTAVTPRPEELLPLVLRTKRVVMVPDILMVVHQIRLDCYIVIKAELRPGRVSMTSGSSAAEPLPSP